jgi:alpha-D-ribose 1-methylphosphonate 5-triphosphate synthase subunit PhnG
MEDPHDRNDRFELIAAAEGATLARFADRVLETDPSLAILQEPRPQLVMQRVREPVQHRAFNLGEVVVTPAEVRLDGADGFAMRPGKAERDALSGAILDAAVAGDHPESDAITTALAETGREHEAAREREWRRSQHTTVEFEVKEEDV